MSTSRPTPDAIAEAVKAILAGDVIVMPTETVYGLAANALDKSAVSRIFAIKGRPSENPLIVHVLDADQAKELVEIWSDLAQNLADRFWPGPLTLVLRKNDKVPDATTAGLPTVAVRAPSHPVAREIIAAAGVPIAAPSANPFMALSPTTVSAVSEDILSNVSIAIDGGPCEYGLESTVVDLSEEHPRILRPGAISRAEIQSVVGRPLGHLPPSSVTKAPGMYPRHYAPKSKMELIEKLNNGDSGLTFDEPTSSTQIKMPSDPRAYAASLYEALRIIDSKSPSTIKVQVPPDSAEWEAVRDRLKKACHSQSTDLI